MRCNTACFAYLSHSALFIPYSRSHLVHFGQGGENGSDPHILVPKMDRAGVRCNRTRNIRRGVAPVSNIPAGRLRNSPQAGR